MFIGIKLTPQIKCEYICYQIQKLLDHYQKTEKTENTEDSLLVIKIHKITNDDSSLVKKLEYKN